MGIGYRMIYLHLDDCRQSSTIRRCWIVKRHLHDRKTKREGVAMGCAMQGVGMSLVPGGTRFPGP